MTKKNTQSTKKIVEKPKKTKKIKNIALPDQGSLPRWIYSSLIALPNEKLLGEKERKKWIYLTSNDFAQKIKILALTLKKLGVKKGEPVGIVSSVGISCAIFDQAVMSCGAISVNFFEDINDDYFCQQVKQTKIKTFLISGKKAYQKCTQNAKNIERIIIDENYAPPTSQKFFKKSQITHFDSSLPSKKKISEKEEKEWEKMLSQLRLDQIASIVYTNGSNETPQAFSLTHRCFMNQIKHLTKCFRIFGERDRCVSFLSLAHTFERVMVYFYLSRGVSVYFCKKETELENVLQKVKPTMMTLMPRILKNIYEKIEKIAKNEKGVKKMLMHLAINEALQKQQQQSLSNKIYDYLIYKKIRKSMGGELRFIICTGAILDKRDYLFFTNVGLPIFEGYETSKASAFVSINHPTANKPFSVGQPLAGVKTKLSSKGEWLIKSDSVAKNYFGKTAKKNSIKDKNEWISTGKIAKIDKKGFIEIVGHLKTAIKMLNGKNIYPEILECELAQNSFVKYSLVIADDQKNINALIFIDPCDSDELLKVKKSVKKTIDQINKKRDYLEQIKKYSFVEKKLTIKDGELTPKLNLKKNEILKQYKKNIEKLFTKN